MTAAQRTRYDALQASLAALRQAESAAIPVTMAYCGQFTAPDPIYFLKGGDVMRRGELVTPGALSQITALPSDLSAPAQANSGPLPAQNASANHADLRLVGNAPRAAKAPCLPPRMA